MRARDTFASAKERVYFLSASSYPLSSFTLPSPFSSFFLRSSPAFSALPPPSPVLPCPVSSVVRASSVIYAHTRAHLARLFLCKRGRQTPCLPPSPRHYPSPPPPSRQGLAPGIGLRLWAEGLNPPYPTALLDPPVQSFLLQPRQEGEARKSPEILSPSLEY